jgi:hypothetical protein
VKTVLLDANVLIALLWPAHQHHDAAHWWFGSTKGRRWATCPLTELAFVRIVSNPAFSSDALNPADALTLLEQNLTHPFHVFWPDSLPVRSAIVRQMRRVESHRQVTDGYLVALATTHRGMLATFDAGLKKMTSEGSRDIVELVPSPVSRLGKKVESESP